MAQGTKVALALITLLVGVLVVYYGFVMEPAASGDAAGRDVVAADAEDPAADAAGAAGLAGAAERDLDRLLDERTVARSDAADAAPLLPPVGPVGPIDGRSAGPGPGRTPAADAVASAGGPPSAGRSVPAGLPGAIPVGTDERPVRGLDLVANLPESEMAPEVETVPALPAGGGASEEGDGRAADGGLRRRDLDAAADGRPIDMVANGHGSTRDDAAAARAGSDGNREASPRLQGPGGRSTVSSGRPTGREPAAASRADAAGGTWTIRPGDTLSGIAQLVYGRASAWRTIAAANPGLDPNRLRPGREIRLPPAGAVSTAGTPARPAAGAASRRGDGPAVHVVRAGETLSDIAARHYGRAGAWERIYRENRRLIGGDPDALEVGMELVIPGLE